MLQAHRLSLPQPPSAGLRGLFLITAGDLDTTTQVVHILKHNGVQTAVLPEAILSSPDRLSQVVAQLRQQHGKVAGIIHLAPLISLSLPTDFSTWQQLTQRHVKSLFQLVQLAADDLRSQPNPDYVQVLVTANLGGHWGRQGDSSIGLPTSGGAAGIVKTLALEWPGVTVRAVDFDAQVLPEQRATALLAELRQPKSPIEIGYAQGQRWGFIPERADLSGSSPVQMKPTADWVVLVTGGARGITAETIAAWLIPGMTLILVGRSPEPSPESADTQGIESTEQLRTVLLQRAHAQNKKPKPAEIEQQIQAIRRDRQIRQYLQQFRQIARRVEYWASDVRNEAAVEELLQGIYQRYHRLDAVIHGAGVIEDKQIVDKSLASFNAVFDTKVDSLFLLQKVLQPESLKLLVLFGSVAGSFGNRGQADYAAANELMNRFAWQLAQQWQQTRIVVINWGPWDIIGMASPAVNAQFKARGVMPIPPAAGQQFFVHELQFGKVGTVEVVAGDMEQAFQKGYAELEMLIKQSEKPAALLRSHPKMQPNSYVTLAHHFSLKQDPYLQDHALDGKLVVPAAVGLEVLTEFVQTAWSEGTIVSVQEFRVLRGIAFDPAIEFPVTLQARASSHADAESLHVLAEIAAPTQKGLYYRGTFVLQFQPETSILLPVPPLESGKALSVSAAYLDYCFHGPQFQLLQSISRISEAGADATVIPSQVSQWLRGTQPASVLNQQNWIFDPGLVDASLQLALIWLRVNHDYTGLPSRIGSIHRSQAPTPALLQLALRAKRFNGTSFVFDATFSDDQQRPYLQLIDVETTCSKSLNRLNVHWRQTDGRIVSSSAFARN